VEHFGIPANRIFNSRDNSFVQGLKSQTDGRGVDIVLNSLSGPLLHSSWDCIAKGGIMVEIGKRDFRGQAMLSMESFETNRSFVGFDLIQLTEDKPLVAQK
jgi:NADPH:quinone reductase-like Zn-dependent oxidoreductase